MSITKHYPRYYLNYTPKRQSLGRWFNWIRPVSVTVTLHFSPQPLCDNCFKQAKDAVNEVFGCLTEEPYGFPDELVVREHQERDNRTLVFDVDQRKLTAANLKQLDERLGPLVVAHDAVSTTTWRANGSS